MTTDKKEKLTIDSSLLLLFLLCIYIFIIITITVAVVDIATCFCLSPVRGRQAGTLSVHSKSFLW